MLRATAPARALLQGCGGGRGPAPAPAVLSQRRASSRQRNHRAVRRGTACVPRASCDALEELGAMLVTGCSVVPIKYLMRGSTQLFYRRVHPAVAWADPAPAEEQQRMREQIESMRQLSEELAAQNEELSREQEELDAWLAALGDEACG